MSSVLKISEATSLALHSMVLLSVGPQESLSTWEMAGILKASEAHLAKVLQRLSKQGLVRSVRGPRGGFVLGRSADDITLLEVYEAVEGPLASGDCLLDTPVCGGECILGDLLHSVNGQVRDYLSQKRISDLRHVYACLTG